MAELKRPHQADGIEEYDNPLPSWWVGLFLFTIVFSVVYLVYYHALGGESLRASLDRVMVMSGSATSPPGAGGVGGGGGGNTGDGAAGLGPVPTDAASLAEGRAVYAQNCTPCHGALGEGGIGPNLTDRSWIHGGASDTIARVIFQGVPEKGMIAWGPILGPKKVLQVAGHVLSLKGSNPPNAKAPEGTMDEGAQSP